MEKLLFFLLALTIFSCSSKKQASMETEQNKTLRLHDLWSLRTIEGNELQLQNEASRPLMELFIEEMKIRGNSGCNSTNGSIQKVTETELQFGGIATTKMMCPDMKTEQAYLGHLRNCATYVLKDLILILFNTNGKELMTFRKVD